MEPPEEDGSVELPDGAPIEPPPDGAPMEPPGALMEPLELPSVEGVVDEPAGQRESEGFFLHSVLSALGDRGFLVGELVCANT